MSSHIPGYNYGIAYLRATIIVLVIGQHAMSAYNPMGPALSSSLLGRPRWWETYPVEDAHRWQAIPLLSGFNDAFFMSLMFFISGLFVWRGLTGKGPAHFLRDRLKRLGLPFLLSVALLAPIAYYPAYLQRSEAGGMGGYWSQWRDLGHWPGGPAWFISVLLAFDVVTVLLFALTPGLWKGLIRLTSALGARPITFFAALVVLSAVAYCPLAIELTPYEWITFGPFAFQTSRILHYLLYFLLGVGVGAQRGDGWMLAPDGELARHWPFWLIGSLVIFGLTRVIATPMGFVLSCATLCFAFLALFIRFARSPLPFFDSLSANAYGIYLIHYGFVTWGQFVLLPAPSPAPVKLALVWAGALFASWGIVAATRHLQAAARAR